MVNFKRISKMTLQWRGNRIILYLKKTKIRFYYLIENIRNIALENSLVHLFLNALHSVYV